MSDDFMTRFNRKFSAAHIKKAWLEKDWYSAGYQALMKAAETHRDICWAADNSAPLPDIEESIDWLRYNGHLTAIADMLKANGLGHSFGEETPA